jgi:dTDP-4-amino-4,6-dideoxygalactose transaminase
MKVSFVDLKQRFEEERDEILSAVERVLSSGQLILGDSLRNFEREIEIFTGAKHCIGLNSGTDALMMSLWSAGIGKGDEVIHPAISFIATTGAIVHVGAKPVFCDVLDNGLIDPDRIIDKISSRTKAIMPVHWAGKMCDMDKIMKICKKYNLLLLEDSAQAMGSYFNGVHGGRFGVSGSFSCHPLKNLNALGDGGFLITDDDNIASKVKLYRNHGIESRDNVVSFGVNSRLDNLHAEVLKIRLSKLNAIIKKRRNNADLYRKLIHSKKVKFPLEDSRPGFEDSYVMFLCHLEKRDELKLYLSKNEIESMIYYGTPLHLHKASEKFGHQKGDFPISENLCDNVLALPIHQNLTMDQIEYVSEKINNFYAD